MSVTLQAFTKGGKPHSWYVFKKCTSSEFKPSNGWFFWKCTSHSITVCLHNISNIWLFEVDLLNNSFFFSKNKFITFTVVMIMSWSLFGTKESTTKILRDVSFQAKSDMKRCGKCKLVCYCSKECQSNDWSSHKRQCKRQGI